jgi:hypothetical protein
MDVTVKARDCHESSRETESSPKREERERDERREERNCSHVELS